MRAYRVLTHERPVLLVYLKLNMKYSNALRLSWAMEGERRAERKEDREGEQLETWEMMICSIDQ